MFRYKWISIFLVAMFLLAACGGAPATATVPATEAPVSVPTQPFVAATDAPTQASTDVIATDAVPTRALTGENLPAQSDTIPVNCNDGSGTFAGLPCKAMKADGTYYEPNVSVGCIFPDGTTTGTVSPYASTTVMEYAPCTKPLLTDAFVQALPEDIGVLLRFGPGGESTITDAVWWLWDGRGIDNGVTVTVLGCSPDYSADVTTFSTAQYSLAGGTEPDRETLKMRALVQAKVPVEGGFENFTSWGHVAVLNGIVNGQADPANYHPICDVATLP